MANAGVKKTTAKKTASLAALEAEATSNIVEIEFRGETLRIDPDNLDDFEMFEQLSRGMPFLMLDALLGTSDVRQRLLDTCEKNKRGAPKLSSVGAMVQEIAEAVGAGK